ncbi:hypothetical protein G9A89_003599 [Geosiphon pyriformis]|nr:hypothetical protein G9A89_003599 [Geosiphon pyriformis]
MKTIRQEPIITASLVTINTMVIPNVKESKTMNHILHVKNSCLTKEYGTIFLVEKKHVTLYASTQSSSMTGYSHNEDEIWQITNAKVEGTTLSKILEIKNNPSEPVDIVLIPNPNAFLNIETNSEKFHEHYQNLAPTRKKQEQCLAQLNT